MTSLGLVMAKFPVSPRCAKMLTLGHQNGCLPYIIALVAALSVKVGGYCVKYCCFSGHLLLKLQKAVRWLMLLCCMAIFAQFYGYVYVICLSLFFGI